MCCEQYCLYYIAEKRVFFLELDVDYNTRVMMLLLANGLQPPSVKFLKSLSLLPALTKPNIIT